MQHSDFPFRRAGALIAASAALIAFASGAVAQTMAGPAHPPPPVAAASDDPVKVAAAREFLIAFHPRSDPKVVSQMIDKMMPQVVKVFKEDNPKKDPNKFAQDRRAALMDRAVRSLDLQSHVVSRHFSLQELKGLTAFYRGPLGRRLTDEIPKIQGEVMREARLLRMPPGMKPPAAPNTMAKPAPAPHK